MKYDKLVRDRIPKILKEKNVTFSFHVADEREYKEKLLEKLREEVDEFVADTNLEELADIEEVLLAIRKYFYFSKDDIESIRKEKAERRGAFEQRIILQQAD